MFDTIKCDYPLPLEGANELSYQTKDLDNALDFFHIKEDGTIWQQPKPNSSKEPKQRIHNGSIEFYTMLGQKGWVEWEARFNNGKIIEIKLKVFRPDKYTPVNFFATKTNECMAK